MSSFGGEGRKFIPMAAELILLKENGKKKIPVVVLMFYKSSL